MKKKIIALTLTAALALSSTSAFAATNCAQPNYNFNLKGFLEGFSTNPNMKEFKLNLNGKTIDLNSIDWSKALNEKATKTIEKQTNTENPAVTQPAAVEKVVTEPVVTQPVEVENIVTEPETTKPVESTTTSTTENENTANNTTVSSSNLTYEQQVAELVNIERQKVGLPALELDSAISNVARTKSKDMATNNYFAHQSPTYGSAGDMLKQFGINWSAWGENIASGQKTPEAVVTAWMNSSGHRANILSSNFSKIGIGYVTNSNGTPYWTQMFTN